MGEPVQPWTPPDEAALAILRYTSLDVWRTSTDILGRSSLENTLRHPNIPILKVEIPPEDAAKTAYKSPSRWTNVKEMFSSSPKTPDRDSPNIQAKGLRSGFQTSRSFRQTILYLSWTRALFDLHQYRVGIKRGQSRQLRATVGPQAAPPMRTPDVSTTFKLDKATILRFECFTRSRCPLSRQHTAHGNDGPRIANWMIGL